MTICLNSINFIWIFLASVIISYIIYIKTKNNYTFILICSLTLYIVFFICITIFPITILSRSDLNQLYSQYGKYIKYYQLIPFKTILGVGSYNFFRQVICNIILFIPMPVFMKIIVSKLSGVKVVMAGMACSILVEIIQLFIDVITRYPSHVCDIDDFILNSTGVVIGYLIYLLINRISITNKIFKRLVYEK